MLCCALAACGGNVTSAQTVTYVATLRGENERPRATASAATGSAVFALSGGTATYTVTAVGFAGALTVGHVHIGAGNATGPVIVPFTIIAQSGTVAAGSIALRLPIAQGNITISGDSLRALFDAGLAYVNLYSAAYPDGEIRGQILRQ